MEIHIACGGVVKLVGERWKCARCSKAPIAVTETTTKKKSLKKVRRRV